MSDSCLSSFWISYCLLSWGTRQLQWSFVSPCFRCSAEGSEISAQALLWSAALWYSNADSPDLQDWISWCCVFLAVSSTAYLPACSFAVQLQDQISSWRRYQMLFLSPRLQAFFGSYRLYVLLIALLVAVVLLGHTSPWPQTVREDKSVRVARNFAKATASSIPMAPTNSKWR